MPHPAVPWLVDREGDVVERDVFDLETWRDFEWSIFSRAVRERTVQRKGGGVTGRRYLGMLEDYLGKHLDRGRNFMMLLGRAGGPGDVRPYVFGGDCDETVFLCERHQFLTGNATFQNNLQHTLLNLTRRAT